MLPPLPPVATMCTSGSDARVSAAGGLVGVPVRRWAICMCHGGGGSGLGGGAALPAADLMMALVRRQSAHSDIDS